MLHSLSISNIVLIDRLDLAFEADLCVLTGETGAGKSILLDALGLALGARAAVPMVREGAAQGSVSAVFELPPDHPVWVRLAEQGLAAEEGGQLILRRVIDRDGRSRAFVNDQSVSVGLLKDLGDMLVEIHGQHADRGLVQAAGHRRLLDAFGGLDELAAAVRDAHADRLAAAEALAREQESLAAARADEEYLRHAVAELDALAPEAGEEERLAAERTLMMQSGKIRGALDEVQRELTHEGGAESILRSAIRRLERMTENLGDQLEPLLGALERAAMETAEAIGQLEDLASRLDFDAHALEATESRLFAIRAMARKHHCTADDLPALRDELHARLSALDHGEEELERLAAAEAEAAARLGAAVEKLREARMKAAERLAKEVNGELAPLKLDKAKFRVRIDPLDPADWTEHGGERVEFEVSTNPGAPFGPLMRIASGGEQARFILALKVALARQGSAPTLIFDEVDRGVGGAVAEAVGERLAKLARGAQVIVVTHSPQVAAAGRHHWRIAKTSRKLNGAEVTVTSVTPLDAAARREEIARMLAGAVVTDAARAAADQLMQK